MTDDRSSNPATCAVWQAVETHRQLFRPDVGCPYCKIYQQEAEIERLRAALQKLDNGYKYPTEVCQIAREALSGEHPPSRAEASR